MSYIELKNVVKTYNDGKVRAADGISFEGEKGEIIVVVGPSGARKDYSFKFNWWYGQCK